MVRSLNLFRFIVERSQVFKSSSSGKQSFVSCAVYRVLPEEACNVCSRLLNLVFVIFIFFIDSQNKKQILSTNRFEMPINIIYLLKVGGGG